MEHLYPVDVNRIQRPRQPFLPLFKFLRRVIKLRKSGVPLPACTGSECGTLHALWCLRCTLSFGSYSER